jgi:hypothetical protein
MSKNCQEPGDNNNDDEIWNGLCCENFENKDPVCCLASFVNSSERKLNFK